MPLSFSARSNMPCQCYANLEGQRSHECERGTQEYECVRHNGSHKLSDNWAAKRLFEGSAGEDAQLFPGWDAYAFF